MFGGKSKRLKVSIGGILGAYTVEYHAVYNRKQNEEHDYVPQVPKFSEPTIFHSLFLLTRPKSEMYSQRGEMNSVNKANRSSIS